MVGLSALIPYLGNFILDAAVRTLVISLLFGATVYYTNASPQLNATLDGLLGPHRHPPAPVVPAPPDAPRTGGNHAFTEPRDYRHQPDPIRHASRSSYMRLIAPVSSSAPCPILASSVPPRPSASAGQPVPKRATRKWLYLSKKGKSSKGKDPDKRPLRKCGGPSLFQYLRLPRPGRRRVQQRLIGRQRPHVLDGTPRSQHRHDRLARSREKVDAECVDIPSPSAALNEIFQPDWVFEAL